MSDRIHSVNIDLFVASYVALSLTRTITGADPQITPAAAVTVSATRAALAAGRFACRDADAECIVYMRAAALMRDGVLGAPSAWNVAVGALGRRGAHSTM